ncbi:MAG: hypothetical protein H6581_08775 [Bacteroidia bacterium]|nr:hypothetical protein [Bacteroidia bacterium]
MKKAWLISILFIILLAGGAESAFSQIKIPSDDAKSGQSATLEPDSLPSNLDTAKKAVILPNTETVSPELFFRMVNYRSPARAYLPDFQYYDELERLPGFSVTLGQTGKPYRRYLYGVQSAFFPSQHYINPILGTEEAYVRNLETEVPFYDTHTPFVNVRYDQGGRNLNIIDGVVSANATPFVNVAVGYKHRRVKGAYVNNETDQYNLFFSNHIHTFNNRYQLFFSAVYNEQKDQFNGGTYSNEIYENSWGKAFQPVLLSGNLNRRFHRGARLLQMFRVNKDSSHSPHKFQILADILADKYDMKFEDATFPQERNSLPVPAYVTITDTNSVNEYILMNHFSAKGAASYRFEKGDFYLGARGGIQYQYAEYKQVGAGNFDNRVTNFVAGEAGFVGKPLEVNGYLDFKNTLSTLFPGENLLHVGGNLKLGPRIYDHVLVREKVLKDQEDPEEPWYEYVSHLPIELNAEYLVNSRNPSYFQMFYVPAYGNTFQSVPTLRNPLLNHLKVGASFTGRSTLKGEEPYPASPMFGLNVFFSSLENAVFYDDSMLVLQALPGNVLSWSGVEVNFRIRFGKFYLQNQSTIQGSKAPAGSNLEIYYNKYIPNFFGKTAFFFETREAKIAKAMRIGLEMHYRTGYRAMYFDSGTQEWYAQLDNLPNYYTGYARLDAFINLQIKRVHLHFRLINATEGLGVPGYYDTPYHPALGRTFILGLNWNFFD